MRNPEAQTLTLKGNYTGACLKQQNVKVAVTSLTLFITLSSSQSLRPDKKGKRNKACIRRRQQVQFSF